MSGDWWWSIIEVLLYKLAASLSVMTIIVNGRGSKKLGRSLACSFIKGRGFLLHFQGVANGMIHSQEEAEGPDTS